MYLDECGTKDPKPQIDFPYLSMAAVLIEKEYYWSRLSPQADDLKRKYWPGKKIVFHEPAMRDRVYPFSFDNDLVKWREFYDEYASFIAGAQFVAVGAILDKAELFKLYNAGVRDAYLPTDAYAIAYDFLMEGICHALYYKCGNAVGTVYPESIQDKPDALLQIEHSRIYMKGTRRISGSWFQYQLRPGLHFFRKGEALGNEIADTVARTIADHRLARTDKVALWDEVSPKLYCGDVLAREWGSYRFYPDVVQKNAPDDKHQTRRLGFVPNSTP